jgi:hypothetical protein
MKEKWLFTMFNVKIISPLCIKDINISNIGGRVDLKVTFSQQNTEHIIKRKKEKKAV